MTYPRCRTWLFRALSLCLLPMILTPVATHPSRALTSASSDWQPVLASDFSTNRPGAWPVGNHGRYNEHVDHGRYTLSVAPSGSRFEAPVGLVALGDGRMTSTLHTAGSGGGGLAARLNPATQTAYVFWIDNAGAAIGLRRAFGDLTLLFSLHSAAIIPSGDNTLALGIDHGQITFAINQHQVAAYRDAHPLPAGPWGIYVASTGGGDAQASYRSITLVGHTVAPVLPSGPFQPILDTDFSLGDRHDWTEGNQIQANTQVENGRLTISVLNGYSQFGVPRGLAPMADGQIAAVLRLEGRGRVGLMGRWTGVGPSLSLYSFWITNRGEVGAWKWKGSAFTTLFTLDRARVRPDADNILIMRIRANTLSFYLNDALIRTYTDRRPLQIGYWGAFVASSRGEGPTQGHFLHIVIAG